MVVAALGSNHIDAWAPVKLVTATGTNPLPQHRRVQADRLAPRPVHLGASDVRWSGRVGLAVDEAISMPDVSVTIGPSIIYTPPNSISAARGIAMTAGTPPSARLVAKRP
jgi:hypothetical protein